METTLEILEKSLLPFYTLFSVFVILSYQEINNKIRSAYNSFREWLKFRLASEDHQERVILGALGVDKEPDSWLDKDVVFHMLHFYKNVNEQSIEFYKKASADYYFYTKDHLKFKKYILGLLVLLTILMATVMYTRTGYLERYPSLSAVPLLGFYSATFLCIFDVLKGPRPKLNNNTITNRRNDKCLSAAEKEIKELEELVYSI